MDICITFITEATQANMFKYANMSIEYEQLLRFLDSKFCFVYKHLCSFTLQVRCENLRKERDIMKQVERRLNQEKESILAEQRGQNLLLANLKSIQVLLWPQLYTVLVCV